MLQRSLALGLILLILLHPHLANSRNAESSCQLFNGEITEIFHVPTTNQVIAWSPDSTKLAVAQFPYVRTDGLEISEYAGISEAVRIWNVRAPSGPGTLVRSLELTSVDPREFGFGNLITGNNGVALAWSPDGTRIAAAYLDSTMRVWSRQDRWVMTTIQTERPVSRSIVWSPDSRWIANDDDGIRIWDAASGEMLAQTRGAFIVRSPANWFAVIPGGNGQPGEIINLDTGARLFSAPGYLLDIAVTENGGRAITRRIIADILQGWDVLTGQQLWELRVEYVSTRLSQLAPTGQYAAIVTADIAEHEYGIKFIDGDTGEVLYEFAEGENSPAFVAWSPDGLCFAWTHNNTRLTAPALTVVDVTSGERMDFAGTLRPFWSPDSTLLAVIDEGTVRVWGVE